MICRCCTDQVIHPLEVVEARDCRILVSQSSYEMSWSLRTCAAVSLLATFPVKLARAYSIRLFWQYALRLPLTFSWLTEPPECHGRGSRRCATTGGRPSPSASDRPLDHDVFDMIDSRSLHATALSLHSVLQSAIDVTWERSQARAQRPSTAAGQRLQYVLVISPRWPKHQDTTHQAGCQMCCNSSKTAMNSPLAAAHALTS